MPSEAKYFLAPILAACLALPIFDLILLKNQAGHRSWREAWRAERAPSLFFAAVLALFFVVQVALNWLLPSAKALELIAYRFLDLPRGADTAGASGWGALGIFAWSYAVVSFWDYLSHRVVLHSRFFWPFHEYHHLPKRVFTLTPGISARPYVFLTTLLTYLPSLPLIAFALRHWVSPATAVYSIACLPIFLTFLAFVLVANHSLCLRNRPWAERLFRLLLLSSPAEHILHHSVRLHGNYGNFSVLWDRIFGTYLPPARHDPLGEPLGLSYDQDFLGTLCMGKLKLSPSIRAKWGVDRFCNLK